MTSWSEVAVAVKPGKLIGLVVSYQVLLQVLGAVVVDGGLREPAAKPLGKTRVPFERKEGRFLANALQNEAGERAGPRPKLHDGFQRLEVTAVEHGASQMTRARPDGSHGCWPPQDSPEKFEARDRVPLALALACVHQYR